MSARWDWTVLGGWVAALVVLRSARMAERDPYWQARDGQERFSGVPLSRPDSWSWAEPEGTFRPTSPAWNTALGIGHEALDLTGLALVGAVGMLAYFAVAILVARRLGARPLPTLLAIMVVAALALPMVSPRATIIIEALLLVTLGAGYLLVNRALPDACWTFAGAAAAAGTLGWLGSWLHVSWSVTALGLSAALPLLAILSGAARQRLGLTLAAGAALAVGSVLGPYGWSVWQLLFDVGTASGGQIIEWLSPFTAGLRARWLPVAVLCLALAGACSLRLARHRGGTPGSRKRSLWALEFTLAATSLAAALAGLVAIRFLGVAALTLMPVLAAEISSATVRWRSAPSRKAFVRTRLSARYWRPILTGVLVLLLPMAVLKARDPGRPSPEADLVAGLPLDCRLFSDPNVAGAVLLLRPDVQVWIDMRTEVYGADAYDDTRRRLFARDGVRVPAGATCAIVPASVQSLSTEDLPNQRWQRSRVPPTSDQALWLAIS